VKRFPNCGSAHRAQDGLLALKAEHGFTADDVEAIHVRAPVTHLNNLMYTAPEDVLQAKFSVEYGLACCLVTGDCGLTDFSAEAVAREDVRALYMKIHRDPVDKSEGEFPTEIHVALKDGRMLTTSIAMPMGSLAAPFPLDQYWAKYEGCVAGVMTPQDAAAVRDALERLPELPDLGPLFAPLTAPFASHKG
jgi:2-methylcitrate dehydratase PrpD